MPAVRGKAYSRRMKRKELILKFAFHCEGEIKRAKTDVAT